MNVNAKAVTKLGLAVLPGFVKRDHGTLINIGSVLSFFALPISTSYSAAKAHVMLFTIGLRDELKDTKVRVQLVLPASTDTEIWDVAGIGVHNLDPATVMPAEDCVDAALAGLRKLRCSVRHLLFPLDPSAPLRSPWQPGSGARLPDRLLLPKLLFPGS
jgi:short-subunit dehydrogenase